eukprot:CAMPEP_0185182552 /NCGR_PEP_ID=MMETSP1140-20130426/1414_1 /TAXON_ID=298111 /ORGANISM="Pavlova sp., Strain CCMP459" /LENGTH=70 /DNA_ID=CAMNT_0027748509 /DNA_START=84 /DNA_END=296 /DNA_ORIENTATION=+
MVGRSARGQRLRVAHRPQHLRRDRAGRAPTAAAARRLTPAGGRAGGWGSSGRVEIPFIGALPHREGEIGS